MPVSQLKIIRYRELLISADVNHRPGDYFCFMRFYKHFFTNVARLSTPDRVLVYPKLLLGITLSIWLIAVLFFGQFPLDFSGNFVGNDFVGFYTGAKLFQDGNPHDLYDFNKQKQFQDSLVAHLPDHPALEKRSNYTTLFINPPLSIFLYLPFSLGSYKTGLLLWWLFGFLCIGLSLKLMQRHIPGLKNWSGRQLWMMTLVFFPTLACFMYGQATSIILLIWTLCYMFVIKRQDFMAGFVLSLLFFKPQLAIGFVLVFIVSLRIKALIGGIVGLSCWLGVSYLIFPVQMLNYQLKAESILELLRAQSYPKWGIHSIFGFFNLTVYPYSAKLSDLLTIIFSVLICLFITSVWWGKKWDPDSEQWHSCLAVTLPLSLLIAIQLFTYDLMLLIFPFFIILGQYQLRAKDAYAYLDGGLVLAWTSVAYWGCFLSGHLTMIQLGILEKFNLPPIGVQLSVLCIVGWSMALWRQSK